MFYFLLFGRWRVFSFAIWAGGLPLPKQQKKHDPALFPHAMSPRHNLIFCKNARALHVSPTEAQTILKDSLPPKQRAVWAGGGGVFFAFWTGLGEACLFVCCLGGGSYLFFSCLGGGEVGGGGGVLFFAVWAGGEKRACVFCCLGGVACSFFCCLGGGSCLFLLFGRGTGVHSLTGLPGSAFRGPTTQKTKQQKKKESPCCMRHKHKVCLWYLHRVCLGDVVFLLLTYTAFLEQSRLWVPCLQGPQRDFAGEPQAPR